MQLGNILTYGVLPWATVIIQKYMTTERPRINYSGQVIVI